MENEKGTETISSPRNVATMFHGLVIAAAILFAVYRFTSVPPGNPELEKSVAGLEASLAEMQRQLQRENSTPSPTVPAFDETKVIALLDRLLREDLTPADAAAALEADADLAPLRSHPNYQQLVQRLRSKSGSNAAESVEIPHVVGTAALPSESSPAKSDAPSPHVSNPTLTETKVAASEAASPLSPAELIAGRKERRIYFEDVDRLCREAQWQDALPVALKMLDLDRQVYADEPEKIAESLATVSLVHEQLNDFAAARPLRQQALELQSERLGETHPIVASARLDLSRVDTMLKLDETGRSRLAEAAQLTQQILAHFQQGTFQEAMPLAQQVLDIRRELLGEQHVDYAQALNNLASLNFALGEVSKAEPLFKQAADIRRAVLGPAHTDFRNTLDNLASVYLSLAETHTEQGDLPAASDQWKQLIAVRTEQFGENHWETQDARLGLAQVAFQLDLSDEKRGPLVEAAQLSQTVSELFGQQKFEEALEAAKKVVELRRQGFGKEHTEIADAIVNVAVLLDRTEKTAEADLQYEEALAIYKSVLGETNPRYADFLRKIAASFADSERLAKAESLYRQTLQIFSDAFGTSSVDYISVHNELTHLLQRNAMALLEANDLAGSRQAREAVVELQQERFGDDNWRCADARRDVRRIDAYEQLAPEQRQKLIDAEFTSQEVVALYAQGQPEQAVELAKTALESRRSILGDDHLDTAESLNNLGIIYYALGDFQAAEPLYKQGLELRRRHLGPTHPAVATSLNNLAELLRSVGEYQAAEPLYREALAISERWAAESPLDFATSLNNLALLHHTTGQYELAKPLYEQALKIAEQYAPQRPADYAQSANNLAGLYRDLGDVAQAEPLYRLAQSVQQQSVGDKHPEFAASLSNLGMLLHGADKFEDAESLYRQAAEIQKEQAPAEKHPDYAKTLTNLAGLLHDTARFEEAGQLYREVLDMRREVLGDKHPEYATSLGNLAAHYRSVGKFDEAETHYQQALGILKAEFGESHTLHVQMLRNLSKLYDARGDAAKAATVLQQSLELARGQLDQMADIQSERQQLAMAKMFRGTLDMYLSLATRSELPADQAYQHVLRWKGSVFARQLRVRDLRRMLNETDNPDLKQQLAELDSIACRIATLALSTPAPGEQQQHLATIGELSSRKEKLEVEIASQSRQFQSQKQTAACTPERLQSLLPEKIALVDLIEYEHSIRPPDGTGKWKTDRRVLAFISRAGKPTVTVNLGSAAAIEQAVTLWRGTIKRPNPIVDDSDPAIVLRDTVWLPIEQHLESGDTVLLSPDGALSRMPMAALPGSDPNTYLLEERSICIVPVPQLLPDLLAEQHQSDAPSMLLIGDVDYDAELVDPSNQQLATAMRSGLFGEWKALPETRTELVTVGDSFDLTFPDGRLRKLRQHLASEATFRAEASQYRWLHLATHGFFAPPDKHSALAVQMSDTRGADNASHNAQIISTAGIGGFHPGVLSGVVFAGVNRVSSRGEDDGVVTAMEVAEMDLHNVEVVILSACETGLGQVAGGEGVLGIQRAFQLAGADTVITSLWTVDDLATQLLMVRFYDQLWQKSGDPISKLEAFRQSQLTLLREGPKRGFTADEPEDKPAQPPRTPPFYWAAFSISGDWR